MKTRVIILLIALLPIIGKSYTWELIGPDSVNVTDICFGVAAMPYWVICADNGMYLYNYSTHETTFHTNGNLPIQGATHLNADKFIVVMGDGSWSDGIWTFDINTMQFEVIEWIPNPTFLFYVEQNSTYYAGFNYGGLYTSTDGLNWEAMPFFADKSCEYMATYENHFVISEAGNINDGHIYWSDDAGLNWTETFNWPPTTYDMHFSADGILYAVLPGVTMSSGLYKSYDYGNTWDIEFWGLTLNSVGFDVFGNKFVGWHSQNAQVYGIAYYEMEEMFEPSFTFYNEGLGNTFINRIRTNPTMSAPALFVCTEGGVYYSYDLVVGEKEVTKEKIEIYPNPVFSDGKLNIILPENCKGIHTKLYNGNGDLVLEKNISNNLSNQNNQIQLPDVTAGIYYYHISFGGNNVVKKLIIK